MSEDWPFLEGAITAEKWREFKLRYKRRTSEANVGKPMKNLVDDNVRELVAALASQGEITDDVIEKTLDTLFGVKSEAELLSQLKGLGMRNVNLQDAIQYVAAFKAVIKDAAQVKIGTALVVDHFINGLRPTMLQELVRNTSPKTVEEAVAVALKMVQGMEDKKAEVDKYYQRNTAVQSTIGVKRPGNGDEARGNMEDVEKKRLRVHEIKCFSCNKMGHKAKDCPTAAKKVFNNNNNNNSNNNTKNDVTAVGKKVAIVCYKCGIQGHKAFECTGNAKGTTVTGTGKANLKGSVP